MRHGHKALGYLALSKEGDEGHRVMEKDVIHSRGRAKNEIEVPQPLYQATREDDWA
jgi:hypothetical protein